jgi:predicted nucleic acid-binding protein
MELRAGIERLHPGKRQRELAANVEWVLDELLRGRILSFDAKAAHSTAAWHARMRRQGRPIQLSDAQIAGIAISRRIPLATRDVSDFHGVDIKLINPWA